MPLNSEVLIYFCLYVFALLKDMPYVTTKNDFVSEQESFSPPEVVNRDDDKQVQDHSDYSDAEQQAGSQYSFHRGARHLPTGVVDVGKADLRCFRGLHYRREQLGPCSSVTHVIYLHPPLPPMQI